MADILPFKRPTAPATYVQHIQIPGYMETYRVTWTGGAPTKAEVWIPKDFCFVQMQRYKELQVLELAKKLGIT